ncbi:MAG: exonuclease domain-containing protein [Pseudomonadota bacterium]
MSRNGIVIDLETTGSDPREDRICSLALIALVDGRVQPGGQLYLYFDPQQPSEPEALQRHGLDDWQLRHQPRFSAYAAQLRRMLLTAPLVIGHHLPRKMRFMNQEFERAALSPIAPRGFCTREAAKRRWPNASPELDACLTRLGFNREGRKHGASEDCALIAALYLFFQGEMKPDIRYPSKAHNLVAVPPAPRPLPPRARPAFPPASRAAQTAS